MEINTREELFEAISEIQKAAKAINELPAASVLACLQGAMRIREDSLLCRHCQVFATDAINRIKAKNN